jgi:hypothetical protein
MVCDVFQVLLQLAALPVVRILSCLVIVRGEINAWVVEIVPGPRDDVAKLVFVRIAPMLFNKLELKASINDVLENTKKLVELRGHVTKWVAMWIKRIC